MSRELTDEERNKELELLHDWLRKEHAAKSLFPPAVEPLGVEGPTPIIDLEEWERRRAEADEAYKKYRDFSRLFRR